MLTLDAGERMQAGRDLRKTAAGFEPSKPQDVEFSENPRLDVIALESYMIRESVAKQEIVLLPVTRVESLRRNISAYSRPEVSPNTKKFCRHVEHFSMHVTAFITAFTAHTAS
jgi:hypothetical protein